jgi:hypothetical protein
MQAVYLSHLSDKDFIDDLKMVDIFNLKYKNFFSLNFCNITSSEARVANPGGWWLNLASKQDIFNFSEKINHDDSIKAVILQQRPDSLEKFGPDLLFLMNSLKKPVVVVLKGLTKKPGEEFKKLLKNVVAASAIVSVESPEAKSIVTHDYGIHSAKLRITKPELPFDFSYEYEEEQHQGLISLEFKACSYAFLLCDLLKVPFTNMYSIPPLSLEILRNLPNNHYYPVYLPQGHYSKWLSYTNSMVEAFFYYHKISGRIFSQKLLEVYLGQLCDGILKIADSIALNRAINTNEEIAAARSFANIAEFLQICATDEFPSLLISKCRESFKYLQALLPKFTSNKAQAICIRGLYAYFQAFKMEETRKILDGLAEGLLEKYFLKQDLESGQGKAELEIGAELSEAFLFSYMLTKKEMYKVLAIVTLDSFIARNFNHNPDIPLMPENSKFEASEIKYLGTKPEEVADVIHSLHLFYSQFNDCMYSSYLYGAFSWFHGNNTIKTPICFTEAGVCFDGIQDNSVRPAASEASALQYLKAHLLCHLNLRKEEAVKKMQEATAPRVLVQ